MKINKKGRVFLMAMQLCMLLTITSCSSKLAYNNLHWLVGWYVDDYVSLTDTQEEKFEMVVKSFIAWHRESELERYIAQINTIKIDVKSGVTQANIQSYSDALRHFMDVALIKFEPEISTIAYSLTDQQVEAFLFKFEQKNLKRIEEFENATNEERLQDRLKKIEARIESFTGELNAEQKGLLEETNKNLLPSFTLWVEFRQTWADAVRDAYALRRDNNNVEGKDNKDEKLAFRHALKRIILQANSMRSAEYVEVLTHNQGIWIATMEQLINSLNNDQFNYFNEELNGIVGDIQDLL